MAVYFSVGISDDVFPEQCTVVRTPMTAHSVRNQLISFSVKMITNPTQKDEVTAAADKFHMPLTILYSFLEDTLRVGDCLISMTVKGLPPLGNRKKYTKKELDNAEFAFSMWEVTGYMAL